MVERMAVLAALKIVIALARRDALSEEQADAIDMIEDFVTSPFGDEEADEAHRAGWADGYHQSMERDNS